MNKKKQYIVFLTFTIITSLQLASLGYVYASSSTGAEIEPEVSADQITYPYVNCDTMNNVFAFDVSKGQDPTDFDVFFEEVSRMGHTIAAWNSSRDGAPPSCVEKLMIASQVYSTCINSNPYTVAEADIIESWVNDGGRLFLMEEYYKCSGVRNITEAFGIMSEPDPYMVTDSDDSYPGHTEWVIFDEGNFRMHSLFGQWGEECYISGVTVFASGWWNDGLWVIKTDTDGTAAPSGRVVASAFDYGTGKVFLIGDSDWLSDAVDVANMADNLHFGINIVRWLNDLPICPREPVGGELLPRSTLLNIAPYIIALALLTLSSPLLSIRYKN
jgi:hypothetical protein